MKKIKAFLAPTLKLQSNTNLIAWESKYDRTAMTQEYKYVMDPETPEGKIIVCHRKLTSEDSVPAHEYIEQFDDVDVALDCFDEIKLTK